MNRPGGLTPGPALGDVPVLCQLPAVSAQPPSPPSQEDPAVHLTPTLLRLTPLTAQQCPLSPDSSHPRFPLPPGGLYLSSRKMLRCPPYLLRPLAAPSQPISLAWTASRGCSLCSCPPTPASPWLPWPTTLQVPRPPRPLFPGPAVCVDKHTGCSWAGHRLPAPSFPPPPQATQPPAGSRRPLVDSRRLALARPPSRAAQGRDPSPLPHR